MKKILLIFYLVICSALLSAQITLVREGAAVTNSSTGSWAGVNIPRSEQTIFTYRNNSITSVNNAGYLLQAGDEAPGSNNNHLDGEVITGNKFIWNGVNGETVITHGLFAGYNINSVVKYNYLNNVPYGIIFKSGTDAGQNMTFTSGGCAYNIVRNGKFAGRVKGINGIKFFNNTFYNGDGSGWYFILVTANRDRAVPSPSTGTKVFNNIFYTTTNMPMIKIESGSLSNFECDYNVYWSTAGEPIFNIDGATVTWSQWRARGYDAHSVIKNPDFINTTDLVPRTRLDFGTDLGTTWQTGLSTTAAWVVGTSPATTNQNGKWQVGARIHAGGAVVTPVVTPVDTLVVTPVVTPVATPVVPTVLSSLSITMAISPNNVNKTLNIFLSYSAPLTSEQAESLTPQMIRVTDVEGKLFLEQQVATGATIIKVPINLQSGFYDVSLTAGGTEMASQKIRVY